MTTRSGTRAATRDLALRAFVLGVIGIALAYASAFFPPSIARLGPWVMSVTMPITMFAMMVLGAVRAGRGIGPLLWPFVLVFILVAGGFAAALWLPIESADTSLWFGLPPRAAVILYGVGLLPLFMLPVVYALTFDAVTLTEDDITRIRAARLPGANPHGLGASLMLGTLLLLQSAALPTLAQPIIGGVVIAYFIVVAIIGTWAARRTRSASDFFVAGQGIGLFTLAIAAMAATISGFAFIGGPGLVYTVGLGAIFIVLPVALTNSMGAWVMAKRLRLLAEVREMMTIPDAIGARYDSRAAQGLAAVAIIIAVIGYMATNILALGLVIDAIFAPGLTLSIWIGTLIVLGYSVSGGILAGIYNDVFQGSLMAFASGAVFWYALEAGGGFSGISRALLASDPALLAPWGKLTPLAALSFYFVFGLGSLGQPHVIHKFFMLRDARRLKWFPLLMTAALSVSLLLFIGVGLAMKSLVLSGATPALTSPDDATPAFLLRFTPVPLAAIVFASVAAAIMSTVNSFMSIGAAAFTHDLPMAFGTRLSNELKWGRIWTVVVALTAAVVAQASGTLVAFLGIFGWGLFASTLVPALAVGLNWTGATRAGAIASICTGLVITLSLETLAYLKVFSFPAGVTASAIALVTALLVFFVVSWVTRDTAASTLAPDVRAVMEA